MAPLITLTTLKTASGEFSNPSAPSPQDAKYTQALTSASSLIRSFTGMQFEVTASGATATPKIFEYDGSGYLDIYECQTISSVTSTPGFSGSVSRTLTTDEWAAHPLNLPVKLWLRLSTANGHGISPEMGFTYNLDKMPYMTVLKPTIITVNAVWGWPEIPDDVEQAAIWTALHLIETPKPYSQEAIENYSRTRGSESQHEAIPERAQVALLPYIIPSV